MHSAGWRRTPRPTRAAREVAEEFFDSRRVLSRLLAELTTGKERQT